jgi:hypothetical protein
MVLKARVILAFAFRLPYVTKSCTLKELQLLNFFRLIITAFLNVGYIANCTKSLDPGIAIVASLSAQEVHLFYSLFSATVPNLKNFLMKFHTAIMMDVGHKTISNAYGSTNDADHGGSYQLSLNSRQQSRGGSSRQDGHDGRPTIGRLRPETHHHRITNVWHDDDDPSAFQSHDEAVREGSQEEMIIRKEIEFTLRCDQESVKKKTRF